MCDSIDKTLLNHVLIFFLVALEVNHSEVKEHLGLFLNDLTLADCLGEVLDYHIKDLLNCGVRKESGKLIRVQRFFNKI